MGVVPVQPMLLVRHVPGGHIDLAADDGLDARGLASLIKGHRAVHDPMVGDGDGGLPHVPGGLRQPVHPAGAVQQGVFRMHMQMNKSHSCVSFVSLNLWVRSS